MNASGDHRSLCDAQPAFEGGMEPLLWILICSELVVFGVLLGAFQLFSTLDPSSLTAFHRYMDLNLASIATAALLTSGFFAACATFRRHPRRNLVAAALGGFAFCGLKIAAFVQEWPAPGAMEGRLAELYPLIVGFHFAHVLFVAFLLLVVAWRPVPRHVATVVTVWHMVDLVWLLILPVIYLG
ncbi:MAG: cytochrome c oxidase subunit 3 family protein [Bosea sp. (in: a-proteobacteria)]|uniref:cytochrome c oxidase subunit 3 family protein n=1 Tax=Bosea sp. (in: a-proteobacteria) TaxID=1871050 RepID=UPI003F7B990C